MPKTTYIHSFGICYSIGWNVEKLTLFVLNNHNFSLICTNFVLLLKGGELMKLKEIEFDPKKLEESAGHYFMIPAEIILQKELDDCRLSVFAFFNVRRGLDACTIYTINQIVPWTGRHENRNSSGINQRIRNVISYLEKKEYLLSPDSRSKTPYLKSMINLTKIAELCKTERFAVLYVDEIQKIMSYKCSVAQDGFLNIDIILLVFTYLRFKIYRRRNKLMLDEYNLDNKNSHEYDIEQRRKHCPEAYDCYLCEIAEDLGISDRAVSRAVSILSELELIYFETLPRRFDGEQWHTRNTIFCNFDKREGSFLLAKGEEYFSVEINNKIALMKKYQRY